MSSGAAAPVAETGPLPTSSVFSVERVVTVLTPLFAAGAAWLSGLVASNVPWAPQLSASGIEGVMIAAFLGTVAVVIKWLHGRQIPAIAALSPLKVTQHTLDALYAEIEAYLASRGHLNEATVQAFITQEVSARLSAAAGGGSPTHAPEAPGQTTT